MNEPTPELREEARPNKETAEAVALRSHLVRQNGWGDLINAIEAELDAKDAAPAARTEWYPIADAPKDARWLIVRLPDGDVMRAHWAEGDGENQPSFKGWFRKTGNSFTEINTPTHFIFEPPLPQPPAGGTK